jgi:hypothetical protein
VKHGKWAPAKPCVLPKVPIPDHLQCKTPEASEEDSNISQSVESGEDSDGDA